MCTKHRFAVISHLGFKLRWMLLCVLQQQGCFHPGAPTGLWVPKCPQKWEPSGACSCRPITSLYVTLLFFLSSHWAFKTCRSPQMGAGCGTLSLCQEASLQSGHPSSPTDLILMQPSSLPWGNGARLFLWSVKQLLDLSEEVPRRL